MATSIFVVWFLAAVLAVHCIIYGAKTIDLINRNNVKQGLKADLLEGFVGLMMLACSLGLCFLGAAVLSGAIYFDLNNEIVPEKLRMFGWMDKFEDEKARQYALIYGLSSIALISTTFFAFKILIRKKFGPAPKAKGWTLFFIIVHFLNLIASILRIIGFYIEHSQKAP